MDRKVIVLGGGIGGLSAAHELVERGFEVEVFELNKIPGGKSRSIPVPNSGKGGRADLPGEHGFRFFPAFYEHLPDTMKRIPYLNNKRGCFDNLVGTSRVEIAQFGASPVLMPTRMPRTLDDFLLIFKDLFATHVGLLPGELEFFAARIWQIMTSCADRRLSELECISWWDFIGAETRSIAYQKFLAEGLSRSLVAARAQEGSARTVGQVQVHLYFGILDLMSSTDRVLNGPTSDVFLNPWVAYLRDQGVGYHTHHKIQSIDFRDGRIQGVEVIDLATGVARRVEGDWFVMALPIEAAEPLVTPEMIAADPGLSLFQTLAENVRWMNGLQFFLKRDVPVTHGHVLYIDSPWAITSISEPQFWKINLQNYGDGEVKGLISVDISDWDTPGRFTTKSASDFDSPDGIAKEVWEELKLSLNVDGKVLLKDEDLHSFFLDPDIVFPHHKRPRTDINLEPLFINKPDTWRLRPPATSRIPNLFLAADYVQTNTDLACMEAANEAARRSVNAILAATGSSEKPCRLWDMEMPSLFAPWRLNDQRRYDRGLPWNGELIG